MASQNRISKTIEEFHKAEYLIKFSFTKNNIRVEWGFKKQAQELLNKVGYSYWTITEVNLDNNNSIEELNRWNFGDHALVLYKRVTNGRTTFEIDINDTAEHETAYYYQLTNEDEAIKLFDSMGRAMFVK